jgi:hypothetical protein
MLIEAFGGEGGETKKDETGVVEGLMAGDGEVVLPSGGMRLGACGDGAEVGHEAEDALWLLALEWNGIAIGIKGDGPSGFRLRLVGVFCGLCGRGLRGALRILTG